MNTQTAISRRQLTASETDKRPWLRVAVSLSRPVELYDWSGNKGVDATFKFDIKNFGESPAINIRIAHPMVLHPGNVRRFELNKPQQDACAVARKDADANTIGGVTAFPGEPVSIEEGSGNSFPRDGSPTLFAVLGCVDYTFAGNRHGQTGFNYMLGTVENGQVVGIPFTEGKPRPYETRTWSDYFSLQALVKDGYPSVPPNTFDIPVSHLYFKPSDMGNYAK